MIKPHGAEELKPLYVEDDAVHTQLLEEAAGPARCSRLFGCCILSRHARLGLLYPAYRLYGRG